jgi:hypothetical protein
MERRIAQTAGSYHAIRRTQEYASAGMLRQRSLHAATLSIERTLPTTRRGGPGRRVRSRRFAQGGAFRAANAYLRVSNFPYAIGVCSRQSATGGMR